MKLRDLFLPKLAHSDPKVRMEAVAKEENMEVLRQVYKKDGDAGVRECARKRVEELESA